MTDFLYGPGHAKMRLMSYANNKGADQPAHLRSVISTFVVHCLDSMIGILALATVWRLQPVSEVEQAGLSLTWSKIPEDTFSRDVAHMINDTHMDKRLKRHQRSQKDVLKYYETGAEDIWPFSEYETPVVFAKSKKFWAKNNGSFWKW